MSFQNVNEKHSFPNSIFLDPTTLTDNGQPVHKVMNGLKNTKAVGWDYYLLLLSSHFNMVPFFKNLNVLLQNTFIRREIKQLLLIIVL